MSKIDRLLAHLERVRETSVGRYIARCPAHDDRAPSLSIADAGADHLLLHCFAGCSVADILAALGLDFDDILPDRAWGGHRIAPRPAVPVRQILPALRHELLTASIVLADVERGTEPDGTPPDLPRLAEARHRILAMLAELDHVTPH